MEKQPPNKKMNGCRDIVHVLCVFVVCVATNVEMTKNLLVIWRMSLHHTTTHFCEPGRSIRLGHFYRENRVH